MPSTALAGLNLLDFLYTRVNPGAIVLRHLRWLSYAVATQLCEGTLGGSSVEPANL